MCVCGHTRACCVYMYVHGQGVRGKLSMISVVTQVQRFHSLTLTLVLIISAFCKLVTET